MVDTDIRNKRACSRCKFPLADMADQTSEGMRDQHTATAFFHILYHLCADQQPSRYCSPPARIPCMLSPSVPERQIRLEPVCLPDRKQMFCASAQPVEHKAQVFAADGIVLVLFYYIPLCIHQIQTVVDKASTA